MSLRQHSSKLVGLAVAVSALSLSFGGWALASHSDHTHRAGQDITSPTFNPGDFNGKTQTNQGATSQGNKGSIDRQPATPGANNVPAGGTVYGDDIYKIENGVVYEYDDGWWEPQFDKKIENGIVYDYDDGRWQVEYDPNTYKSTPKSNNVAPQVTPQAPAQNNVAPQPAPKAPAQNNTVPNSKYKVENGVVYEWDDGRWEREYDKKFENGVIYEYDDGRWENDNDDWDDDWDD